MGIAALIKTQWQAARLVGKKDYDGAIRLVESALSGGAEDASLLVLVAHCHYWAKREDAALASAQKALLLDPNSFEANKFLSGIYARREEYDRAAQHAKHALENYPEPLPSVPKAFLSVVRVVADKSYRSLTETASVKVKRIVSNLATPDVDKARAFYQDILGLEVLMDLGWIRTYGSSAKMTIQLSVMSEGGSGTAVPDMSIEVDDVEEALTRARKAGIAIEYGPASEPWGVRRFYVRDPFGKLINILQHE